MIFVILYNYYITIMDGRGGTVAIKQLGESFRGYGSRRGVVFAR